MIPVHHVEDLERRQRLHHLLGLLASQQRDVVVLRGMFGLSAHDRPRCSGSPARARCG
ncbi:hypothetical protein [Amycolatopsis mediterranei]|uniref:Uncharacterized protein n=1 Tax=Amycolatopsis mediterranei (strain S699) TaxID=713604 RepID=A0A9R0P0V3_AMYMS|nr:hypothetical protein [Amycolatopsis mediterranei]AEK44170.1 hypothetical protein RAM_28465 [Amycolatopsis mediterranei S699]UZF72344.1 hypothetical protein ISP_005683 [Amycolatopsis mediterranei]